MRSEQVHSVIPEGRFFGEIALFTDSKRTISVRARTFCDLFVLTKDGFLQVLRLFPREERMFIEVRAVLPRSLCVHCSRPWCLSWVWYRCCQVAKERVKNTQNLAATFNSFPSMMGPSTRDIQRAASLSLSMFVCIGSVSLSPSELVSCMFDLISRSSTRHCRHTCSASEFFLCFQSCVHLWGAVCVCHLCLSTTTVPFLSLLCLPC